MKSYIFMLLIGLSLVNAWMYLQQPAMVFFPYARLDQTPAEWRLGYEDVFVNTADGLRLHGWYIPHHGSQQTLLFFHGNAGNISHRGSSVEIFHRLGLNVFIFDYRGYGQSQGKPDEKGLYTDARAAWRYLARERGLKQEQVILFGRSLGGAIAAKLASETRPGGLILESSFSSARDMAEAIFPVLSRIVFMRYQFNTVAHMRRVTCPVLVLHSSQDEIVPYPLGEKTYHAANEPKSFVELTGDHNSGFLSSQPGYERALAAFMSQVNYTPRPQPANDASNQEDWQD